MILSMPTVLYNSHGRISSCIWLSGQDNPMGYLEQRALFAFKKSGSAISLTKTKHQRHRPISALYRQVPPAAQISPTPGSAYRVPSYTTKEVDGMCHDYQLDPDLENDRVAAVPEVTAWNLHHNLQPASQSFFRYVIFHSAQ
jgi:hypothetical protein